MKFKMLSISFHRSSYQRRTYRERKPKMKETPKETVWEKKQEEEAEAEAEVNIWKYVFGFVEMAVIKCAIELGIADAIESQGSPMTLSQLSSTLNCNPSLLHRILRFLTHRKIFKQIPVSSSHALTVTGYAQTALSRRLVRNADRSMASFVLLESSPVMLAPWLSLSSRVLADGTPSFEKTNGSDIWSYAEENLDHSKLINDGMACDTRLAVPAIVEGCPEAFDGVGTVVDVGGGNGTAMALLVKLCPWIQAINFDVPHVVTTAPEYDGVKHVGGDMFQSVPRADAAFIKWVLHDWGDEECIKVLRKCREAIPKEKGRVIIVEAVIEEGKEDKYLKDVGLMLDMVMMAHTNTGKERTIKEWEYIIKEAGFTAFTVKTIHAVQSVIMAFP